MKDRIVTILLTAMLIASVGFGIYQHQTKVWLQGNISTLANAKETKTAKIKEMTAETEKIASEIKESENQISEWKIKAEGLARTLEEQRQVQGIEANSTSDNYVIPEGEYKASENAAEAKPAEKPADKTGSINITKEEAEAIIKDSFSEENDFMIKLSEEIKKRYTDKGKKPTKEERFALIRELNGIEVVPAEDLPKQNQPAYVEQGRPDNTANTRQIEFGESGQEGLDPNATVY